MSYVYIRKNFATPQNFKSHDRPKTIPLTVKFANPNRHLPKNKTNRKNQPVNANNKHTKVVCQKKNYNFELDFNDRQLIKFKTREKKTLPWFR